MRLNKLRVGDTGWAVDWTSYIPTLPDDPDTLDRDKAVEHVAYFTTKEEALAYAREVYPKDFFGSVTITAFTVEYLVPEDKAGATVEWAECSECYDGED